MILIKRKNKEKGQASLETLLVLFPFVLVIAFFLLSVFFLLGRVNAQGVMAKATKEVASLGCVPRLAEVSSPPSTTTYDYNDTVIDSLSLWGAEVQGPIVWEYVKAPGDVAQSVPLCSEVLAATNAKDPVPSGFLITGRVVYRQSIPIFSGNSTVSFQMASSSLEDR